MASALEITGYVSREVSLERRWEGKLVYFISNGKLIAFGKAVFSQMRTTQRKKKKHCPGWEFGQEYSCLLS